ncbi:S8 family peptidase [Frankia sp. Cpl3]|nr:S8 family peptidase [Frankia sp. Cpl3]
MRWDVPDPQKVSLARSVITAALEERLAQEETRAGKPGQVRVIFDLNPDFPQGRVAAGERVYNLLGEAFSLFGSMNSRAQSLSGLTRELGRSYVVEELHPEVVRWIVRIDIERAQYEFGSFNLRAIRRVWPDFEVHPLLMKSVATIKADAARATFGANGEGINWAVVDSGVDASHPHFAKWRNLDLPTPLEHVDLVAAFNPHYRQNTPAEYLAAGRNMATVDMLGLGHGTAVAGVIAGEVTADDHNNHLQVRRNLLDGDNTIDGQVSSITEISGVAPRTKIVSYKVFNARQPAYVSSVIAALEHIQRVNDYGRDIRIHGVNLSLGYVFRSEWFNGGYSPLCNEVDRLVQTGVVVVIAAGNSGSTGVGDLGVGMTINDPGNAMRAITVGSTHRDSPHRFGISYFSSKGPTGDGRFKPNIVAPGEFIVSSASSDAKPEDDEWDGSHYAEFTGTSMSAAHVSGAIAAFLSVRREFIGQADKIKEIFLHSATDLGRAREFQGDGLVDVMRAIQSV